MGDIVSGDRQYMLLGSSQSAWVSSQPRVNLGSHVSQEDPEEEGRKESSRQAGKSSARQGFYTCSGTQPCLGCVCCICTQSNMLAVNCCAAAAAAADV